MTTRVESCDKNVCLFVTPKSASLEKLKGRKRSPERTWLSGIIYSNMRPRGLYADDFFKFSGTSLVSVARVRPGNEIKSKW